VVVAAGSGTRLAAGRPKAFVPLAGRTLLEHAVRRVLSSGAVGCVVAVVPADLVRPARELLGHDVVVVPGGPDRSASVRCGLAALPTHVRTVLVHDAARCLVPPELVRRVVEALDEHPAVVPGLPLADTVKQVDDRGAVVRTPDRAGLRLVQTPQGFARDLLERAHRSAVAAGHQATDDAGLVELLGKPVHVVPGDPRALKVTTPDDLAQAGWLLSQGA
jgi:2-C-methyl-D-erythritol 4-phosphate cytidylyltransferase